MLMFTVPLTVGIFRLYNNNNLVMHCHAYVYCPTYSWHIQTLLQNHVIHCHAYVYCPPYSWHIQTLLQNRVMHCHAYVYCPP